MPIVRLPDRRGLPWGREHRRLTRRPATPHLDLARGGGRRVRHAPAATGRRRRRGTGTARGRPGLAAAVVGRLVEQGVERGRPFSVSDGQARGPRDRPRSRRCSRAARAAMTCRTEALGRTACRARRRSRHGAERRVGGHWSRLRGQSVSPPSPSRGSAVAAPWADKRRPTEVCRRLPTRSGRELAIHRRGDDHARPDKMRAGEARKAVGRGVVGWCQRSPPKNRPGSMASMAAPGRLSTTSRISWIWPRISQTKMKVIP